MNNVKKLFFVPVGLPGMGKSTLAKHIKLAAQKSHKPGGVQSLLPEEMSPQLSGAHSSLPTNVSFEKVSYDRILGDNLSAYREQHPEVPFHEIIDIIRGKADQDYLDEIARHCISDFDGAKFQHEAKRAAKTLIDLENAHPNLVSSKSSSSKANRNLPKQIIYLDRNNTPDVWGDIQRAVEENSSNAPGKPKDYRTVVLLPKQEPFDKTLYRAQNPICPHLIFECCKRIFNRKAHGCLSGDNKPKVVEVVLKFAKLHDGFDFEDMQQIHSYFDDVLVLDFMKYNSRPAPLLPETL